MQILVPLTTMKDVLCIAFNIAEKLDLGSRKLGIICAIL